MLFYFFSLSRKYFSNNFLDKKFNRLSWSGDAWDSAPNLIEKICYWIKAIFGESQQK